MTTDHITALSEAAREAWVYALPLIEVASTRTGAGAFGGGINQLTHTRDLADHTSRAVTTPNNDTLYSSAQLDLSHGPVTLNLPASGARYLSVALMDAWTNNFAILGTRTTGTEGGTFRLIGPDEPGGGKGTIRSPTNHVWALARILVDGPHDLEAARAVQSGLSLQGPASPPQPRRGGRSDTWQAYFAAADALMVENPPPATDGALLSRIALLGIGDGKFDPARFSADEAAAIEAGVAKARSTLHHYAPGRAGVINGWTYPKAELGNFGESYGFRALVALSGLAALPPVEAMYMRAVGEHRGLYDGTRPWRLHFPADKLIPVDSFWSLSLYEGTADGQFFFADNPIQRYAIGDRTPGLTHNADGSLDIWISHEPPQEDRLGNWLPAPAGPFALFMRAYFARPALLDGQYRLPAVEPG